MDVYSFGIVMWEIAHRDTPYKDIKWHFDIEKAVMAGRRPDVAPDPLRPEEFTRIMIACWSPDTSKRPAFSGITSDLRMLEIKNAWKKFTTDGINLIESDDSSS